MPNLDKREAVVSEGPFHIGVRVRQTIFTARTFPYLNVGANLPHSSWSFWVDEAPSATWDRAGWEAAPVLRLSSDWENPPGSGFLQTGIPHSALEWRVAFWRDYGGPKHAALRYSVRLKGSIKDITTIDNPLRTQLWTFDPAEVLALTDLSTSPFPADFVPDEVILYSAGPWIPPDNPTEFPSGGVNIWVKVRDDVGAQGIEELSDAQIKFRIDRVFESWSYDIEAPFELEDAYGELYLITSVRRIGGRYMRMFGTAKRQY